jgi:hypothetical protein
MRLAFWLLGAGLLVAPLSPPILAQSPAPVSNTYWLTGGIGRASFEGITEFGVHFSGAYQFRGHVIAARTVIGVDPLGLAFAGTDDVITVEDFGVLFGHGSRPGPLHVSGAAGLGVAGITRKTAAGGDERTTRFGVPLEAQLFWRPTSFLGVGVYGYGNLNSDQSFWGASLSVEVGRLR